MGPNRYPACILFYFAIAVSFLAMGRVALRARDYVRTGTSSVGNPWRSKVVAAGPDVASLPSLTAELKPRSPSLTAPKFRPSGPAEPFPAPRLFVTSLPQPVAHSVPANFSLPITFEPAAPSAGQAVRYASQSAAPQCRLPPRFRLPAQSVSEACSPALRPRSQRSRSRTVARLRRF